MALEAISCAASIALASTILVLLLAETLRLAALPLNRGAKFSNSIMLEAAQRFRDEVRRLASERAIYITCNLVFATTFLVAYFLEPQHIFGGLPTWQYGVMLLLVAIAISCMIYRLSKLVLQARRVEFIRDASIAIGHSLQKLTGNQNRVFHDVPCAAGYIDHVVAGLNGIYAVKVTARKPRKDNRVRLKDDRLIFAPGKESLSLAEFSAKVRQLSVLIRKQIGQEIHVRKVVAVPGWAIEVQDSNEFLIVNERNLVMIGGWKDPADYLMHEDVEAIHNYLTENCIRSTKRNRDFGRDSLI